MDVTVVVGTFGDDSWVDLARNRAIPSAEALGVPVIHHHAGNLHDARNGAVTQVDTEWVCHLDADDELEAGFFEAMDLGTADLRAPAVRYIGSDHPGATMLNVFGHTHECGADCLRDGNWMVVGTLVRTEMVRAVGGWRDFSWSEDWDLWLRCYLAGATVEPVHRAIYRAHVRWDSRNRAPRQAEKNAAHEAIARANGLAA